MNIWPTIMKNKTVLITGGSGYFGEVLVKKLLERNFHCRVFDLNEPDPSLKNRIEFHQGDIRNAKAVDAACQEVDYIFHNVAQVPLAKNKQLFESVNNQGTMNILESSKKNRCQHLVFTSSSAIFGVPRSNPVIESTQPTPMEAYGQAKLKGEQACLQCEQYFNVTIIRPRTILGHGRLGIFQILFEWIYQNKNVPVFDGGFNIYQFVHADDLAEACILSVEKQQSGIFNIGAAQFGSMRDVLQNLIDYSGKNSKIKSLPSAVFTPLMKLSSAIGLSPLSAYHSLMYGKSLYFDIDKARTSLGWTPQYSSNEMMIESYQWYLNNRESILNPQQQQSRHKSQVKQRALSLLSRLI